MCCSLAVRASGYCPASITLAAQVRLIVADQVTVNDSLPGLRTRATDPQRPVESSEVQRQLPDRCGRLQLLYTDTGRRMLWIATAGATNGNPASTMWNSTRRRERSISSSAGKCRPIPSGLSGR